MRLRQAALLIAIGLASPVVAQDTDQRQMAANEGPIWGLRADGDFLAAMREYGACAARDVNTQSRMVMRYLPGSKQSDQALFLTLLNSNSCSDNGRTPAALPAAYRGIVAEYYLARDFDLPAFSSKRSPLKVFSERDAADLSKLSPEARTALPYIQSGTCLANANPAGLTVLFASPLGSAEESLALQSLQRPSNECTPDEAPALVTLFQLRGYLAEGAYRYGALQEAAE